MSFAIHKAERRAIWQIVGIAGVSGSGKTYSALLLGAGLAGPNGKLGFIDTENGRGSLYADDPGIRAALPQGYDIIDLPAPFTPARYIDAINTFEQAGYAVCVIDSGSHEWEGEGGCSDMAEADKGRWNRAKRENKRFVMRLLYANMHIIVCLRAREKSKIIPKHLSQTGKEEVISLGILPVCEKSFMFEMLLSLHVDEVTHHAKQIKCPEALIPIFKEPHMLTKADGERILQWNNTAPPSVESDRLQKRARVAAEDGLAAYEAFFKGLTPAQRKMIAAHEENKAIAAVADAQQDSSDAEELAALRSAVGDDAFWKVLGSNGCEKIEEATPEMRAAIMAELRRLVA
jgi:hypothetical protein